MQSHQSTQRKAESVSKRAIVIIGATLAKIDANPIFQELALIGVQYLAEN